MLTVQNTEAIRRIEEAIGYTFHDKRLLVQVLTRKTYLKIDPEAPDNEVLEFYGDTLMNYHVTNYFMSKYAHMLDDGLFFMRTVEQFTDMRSHYVCNRYLTDRVKALGLARYLRAQNRDAELRRDGEKAYADIFESLVGAIYLDSYQNDNLIRAFILRQLGIEPKRQPEDIEAFDYDSLAASLPDEASAPVQEELEEAEAPSNAVDGADEPAAEESPIEAEEAAVVEAVALPAEAPAPVVTTEEEASAPAPRADEPVAEVAETVTVADVPAVEPAPVAMPMQEALAALCRQLGYDLPTYGETPKNAPNARPVAACTMKYKDAKGKLVKISLNDSGKTLAEATEKAAAKMLKRLERQTAEAARKENGEDKATKKPSPKPVEVIEAMVEAVGVIEEPVAEAPVAVIEELPATADVTVENPVEAEVEQLTMEVEEVALSASEAVEEVVEAVEPAVSVEPVVEDAPDEEQLTVDEVISVEEPSVELSGEPSIEVVAETVAETVAEAVAEEVKPARAPRKRRTAANGTEDKPARKPRKKSAPKADAAPEVSVEASPAKSAEEVPTEVVTEIATEVAEAPAEAKPKTRTRKPRAKKAPAAEAPAEAVTEAVAETGIAAEAVTETAVAENTVAEAAVAKDAVAKDATETTVSAESMEETPAAE